MKLLSQRLINKYTKEKDALKLKSTTKKKTIQKIENVRNDEQNKVPVLICFKKIKHEALLFPQESF